MRGRVAMGICVAALCAPASASAATLTPTRFDDPTPDACLPTDCSLREALEAQIGEAVTVQLKAGRYELSQPLPLQLDSSLFAVTVEGAGARATTIDGNGLTQVIRVVEGTTDATISGVTVTGGNASAGQSSTSAGGGIGVQGAAGLTLEHSVVIGNRAEAGGGIAANDRLDVIASTIVSNLAQSVQGSAGGGLFTSGGAQVTVANTTISGNVAQDSGGIDTSVGGGLYIQTGDIDARNVTFARNRAADGGGVYNGDGDLAMFNTIVADSLNGGACGPTLGHAGDHNLDDDGTCQLAAVGDKSAVDPQLAALADNGGPTDTHRLSASSPAINAGNACQATDQRGVTRPAGACDIGAFEYVAPRLSVIKRVVNDNGGTLGPANFSVHVRAGAADVAGSPQPGTASGRTYALAPGAYTVSEDADDRYTASFSGGCSAAGVVSLAEGESVTCTITNDDRAPVQHKNVNALPKSGTVKVKFPGTDKFVTLDEGEQIPLGTTVDTRKGRVTIVAAAGNGQTSDFYDGLFKLSQTKGKKPITVLTLVEKLTGCKAKGKASVAAKKKKKRRLWGNGKGRFRTKGKHSAATVVGTIWLVEDRCDSTLTRVRRGKVKVRDFAKNKTVTVKAGKRYIARKRP